MTDAEPLGGQVNVQVPKEVREAVENLATATGKTQADVIAAAVADYVERHGRDSPVEASTLTRLTNQSGD